MMQVTKTTIYKLEIERPCGCKIAGDYEDDAYKKARGTALFTACEKHAEDASLVEELLREVLEKEAKDSKSPDPPAPVIHPRTAAMAARAEVAPAATTATPAGTAPVATAATAPARTLRTSGSNGTAGREQQQNRNGYGSPKISGGGPGSHRPEPKPTGQSPFRRADPNAGLSPAAAAKIAKTAAAPAAAGGLEIDIDGDQAPEDPRLTRVLEGMNLFDDEGGDDDGEL